MSHDRREFGPWAETLSSREVTALLAMMYSAPIVFAPIRMFDVAGASAWIAGLLAGVAGAAIVLVWVVLSASFPGRILPEFVGEIVGRQIGWAVNLIFSVYFFYEVAVSNRMIAEVVLHVLPETPIGAIMAMSLIVTAVVTRLGPEVLGRMALIHLGVVSVGFLPMIVALAPLVQLRNFLPVLTGGWLPVFRAASPPAALLGHIALVSFLLPLMSKDPAKSGDAQAHGKEGIKVGMLGIGISWLWFYILLLLEQGVFTAEESRRLAIPALSLARAIDFGAFFERVEVSLLAVWLPAVLLKTCVFLYVGSLTVSHLTATRSYRRYVVPLAGLALPAAYTLSMDLPELVRLVTGTWTVISVIVKFFLPVLLLLLVFIQRWVDRAA